jgi:peroxiredoxin
MPKPPEITLHDPDGSPIELASLAADPLVVVLVRYYGCLPCQAYLRDVDAARERFSEGARVIAVGGSADFQARWLRDDMGIGLPLLLDPDQQVRALARLGNLTARQLLSPRGAARYVDALREGLRPQRITRDTVRAPGVAIFGPGFELLWTRAGVRLGDYASVDELVDRARR